MAARFFVASATVDKTVTTAEDARALTSSAGRVSLQMKGLSLKAAAAALAQADDAEAILSDGADADRSAQVHIPATSLPMPDAIAKVAAQTHTHWSVGYILQGSATAAPTVSAGLAPASRPIYLHRSRLATKTAAKGSTAGQTASSDGTGMVPYPASLVPTVPAVGVNNSQTTTPVAPYGYQPGYGYPGYGYSAYGYNGYGAMTADGYNGYVAFWLLRLLWLRSKPLLQSVWSGAAAVELSERGRLRHRVHARKCDGVFVKRAQLFHNVFRRFLTGHANPLSPLPKLPGRGLFQAHFCPLLAGMGLQQIARFVIKTRHEPQQSAARAFSHPRHP